MWFGNQANNSGIRFRRARRSLRELIRRVIADRRGDPDEDLLFALIDANEAGELTDGELRDNVASFFLAGSDTTSAALTYTLFCLGNNPSVFDTLKARVDEVTGNGDMDFETVSESESLESAIEEAMRLYPPGFSIGRVATEDCELGGYYIPEGSQLILSQWVVHPKEELFDQPDRYRPDRWTDSEDWPKYASFPFGGGDRYCIGSHFAMMEMPIILTRILQRIDFRIITNSIDGLIPAATLRPSHPIEMEITSIKD